MTPEGEQRSLNHLAFFRLKEDYWRLPVDQKTRVLENWLGGLEEAANRLYVYQVFPAEAGIDLMVWAAVLAAQAGDSAAFFKAFALATNPHRLMLEPVTVLWGFTAASVYSKARSTQEIDPFTPARKRYLVVYPFAKTGPWYLKSAETRQGMMNEHIRLGKQFPEIHQLLLYSFGLQDHEFIVVYETDDLPQFSELVRQLRSTEVRLYTALDAPLHTAIHSSRAEGISLWTA